MPGMSTSVISAASTWSGQPRSPSRPVRSEEAMPVSQSLLARTAAPPRSACRQTSTRLRAEHDEDRVADRPRRPHRPLDQQAALVLDQRLGHAVAAASPGGEDDGGDDR